MSLSALLRGIHLLMACFIVACVIVMVDESGVFGEQPALESTADAIRNAGEGNLPDGLEELGEITDPRRIARPFEEVAKALG